MKFAFLIFKYFPYGGVQRDMLRIASDLSALGHDVAIFTGEWRGDMPQDLHVKLLPIKGIFNHQRHQSLIDGMLAEITKNNFDLVVGFNRMPQLDVYFAADPCFVARAIKEKPWWYRFTPRYRFFAATEFAVMRADGDCKILLIEPNEKEKFQKIYQTPDARFHLLSPNIPTRFLNVAHTDARTMVRNAFNLPLDATILISVCANFLLKGVDRSIAALASLPASLQKNVWLVVVGGGNVRAMTKVAKKYGIEQQIIFAGNRDDIPALMHAADVMVHPARAELAGLVLIEAMTSGLPQIVTENCGYAFHVQTAEAGIVISSPFNQLELNAALATMLSDSSRHTMSTSAILYTSELLKHQSATEEASYLVELANATNKS